MLMTMTVYTRNSFISLAVFLCGGGGGGGAERWRKHEFLLQRGDSQGSMSHILLLHHIHLIHTSCQRSVNYTTPEYSRDMNTLLQALHTLLT